MTQNLTGQPAKMEGQAQRIPLKAQEACLHATIQITRKETGVVDTYEIVGVPMTVTIQPEEQK